MLKKTIKYKDLDENPIVEDFYFNLSKAEIAEWRIRAVKEGKDTFDDLIERIKEAKDGAFIIDTFKEILVRSIGRRSEDGKRFIKDQETTDSFMQSEAYSEFIMELFTDPNFGSAFINSVLPADMVMEAAQGKTVIDLPKEDVKVPTPNLIRKPPVTPVVDTRSPLGLATPDPMRPLTAYTQAELMEMTKEQFEALTKQH